MQLEKIFGIRKWAMTELDHAFRQRAVAFSFLQIQTAGKGCSTLYAIYYSPCNYTE